MGELYKLTFSNGKSYIGIAFRKAINRFRDHRSSSRTSSAVLYRAWRKHGEPVMEVLAVMENELLYESERKAISVYGTFSPGGYNLTLGGDGTPGVIRTQETRERIRVAARTKIFTAEHRANIGIASRNRSLETRRKLSIAAKSMSKEVRDKIRLALKNPSIETRKKISVAARNPSPEARAKMRDAKIGKKLSSAHRAKIREFMIKRGTNGWKAPMSSATRSRMSARLSGSTLSSETKEKIRLGMIRAHQEGRAHQGNLESGAKAKITWKKKRLAKLS